MLIKNNKGVAFVLLSALFSLVLILLFFMIVISNYNIPIVEDQNSVLESIDYLDSTMSSKTYHIQNIVPIKLENIIENSLNDIILSNTLEIEDLDNSELISCTNNLDSNSNIIFENEKIENIDCVGQEISEELIEQVEQDITNVIEEEVLNLYPIHNNNLQIDFNEEQYTFNIIISSLTEYNSGIAVISKETVHLDFEFTIFDKYTLILSQAYATDSLSTYLKDEFTCNDSLSICVRNAIIERSNEYLPSSENFEEKYDIRVIEQEFGDDNYDLFNIEISDKDSEELILEYSIILEDVIPPTSVSFELENYNSADKTVEVSFDIDSLSPDIEYLLIVFSYENFELNNNIIDKIISNNEEDVSTYDVMYKGNEFSFTNSNTGYELNYLLIPKRKGFDNILANQIFNYESGNYELLKTDRDIFFQVISLDQSYNYALPDNNIIKTIRAQSPYSPIPIGHEVSESKSSISLSNPAGLDSSILIDIENYDHDFSHFDIYIIEANNQPSSNVQLNQGCEEVEFNCYYYNGLGTLQKTESVSYSYLVSNNPSSSEDYINILSSQFSSNVETLQLREGIEYRVLVVPVDSENRGVLRSYSIADIFEQRQAINPLGESFTYYSPVEPQVDLQKQIRFNAFEVQDLSPPSTSDITLDYITVNPSNNMVLKWTESNQEDILYLTARFIAYEEGSSELSYSNRVRIDPYESDSVTNIYELTTSSTIDVSDYSRLELVEIKPVDSNGNSPEFSNLEFFYP